MRSVALVCVGAALALGACSGSSKTASTPPSTGHVAEVASANPSKAAKMICQDEAVEDLAKVLLVKTTKVSVPTWKDHVYACDYIYPGGAQMTLSVKELSSEQETTAYFDQLAQKLGKAKDQDQLGDAAYSTTNGSVVTRKDFKVLLVDVAKLPETFANDTRANVATNTSFVIMSCWKPE